MPDSKSENPADSEAEDKKDDVITDESEEDKVEGDDSNADKKEDKDGDEESVTISKAEHNRLQAIKRKSEKKRKRSRSTVSSNSGAPFSFEKPIEPNADEQAAENERELNRFNTGVLRTVLKNKDYQKVIEKDKTLAKVLENNPLSLIEGQPVDADDALDQVIEFLDERVDEIKISKTTKKKDDEKDEDGGKPEPTPVKKVEVKGDGQQVEERKTLEDVSRGIMGKVTVGGKKV